MKPSRASNSSSSPEIPQRWLDLFKLIPGYDPVKTAPAGFWFDHKTADKAVGFFETYLSHIEGEKAGQPLILEPWQAAQVGCAFGWKRPDGSRRYREVFDYEPRKNGKTTKCGGLVNLVAFCDGEAGAQIYSAAADREQATLIYRQAKGMILNNPQLQDGVRVYATYKSIEYPGGTVYKALSADADTKHGFNSHFIIVDELHAHPNRDLLDVLMTSTGSRRQPMMWMITTADFDRDSICNEKLDYAQKVRDGIIEDPSFLPCIYEASTEDDWTSPAVWRRVNPNLGVSISEEYLARECGRAKESPAYENTFKRLHLNISTQNDVRWLQLEKWDACNGALLPLEGRECWGGLDLSTTTDIAAFVLVFPHEDGSYDVLPRFWVPQDNAERRERRDRVPYKLWIAQQHIKATPGNVIDYDVIRADINVLREQFNIKEIPVDRWNATQITTQLEGDGVTMVPFGQGFASMTAPTKELEKLVIDGQVRHAGNPVLRWMASNVSVEQDAAGNLKPSKKKSTEKIDGIVALIMGLGRAMVRPNSKSVYEDRGVLAL
jgi:phage terminase large subunit-like protein